MNHQRNRAFFVNEKNAHGIPTRFHFIIHCAAFLKEHRK
jgi:hypothetical protein